jgi:hypothetical protein
MHKILTRNRLKDLPLFITYGVARGIRRSLHCEQREHLRHVILTDITNNSVLIEIAFSKNSMRRYKSQDRADSARWNVSTDSKHRLAGMQSIRLKL